MSDDVGQRLATATGLLSIATLAASAANYGLNIGLARLLEPAEFGDATLIVTLLLGLTAVGVALQLMSARQVIAVDRRDVARLRDSLAARARRLGVALAIVSMIAAPALQALFHTGSAVPFVVLAAGLPAYLVQSVDRGILQGRLQFARLSASFVVEALVRVAGGLVLVWLGLGVTGTAAALSLSFVASWAVMRSPRPGTAVRVGPVAAAQSFGMASRATAVLLVGQIVINNGDVLVAKQVLDARTAGSYAAVALIGRAVFFASSAVGTAAFPFVADRADSGRVVRLGVAAVASISLLAVVVLAVAGDRLGPLLFGSELTGSSSLFVPYGVATAMFAVVANLVATLDVGRDRADGAFVVLGGGILQTVLLLFSDGSPASLVDAQLVAMSIVLVSTVLVHRRCAAAPAVPAIASSALT